MEDKMKNKLLLIILIFGVLFGGCLSKDNGIHILGNGTGKILVANNLGETLSAYDPVNDQVTNNILT